MNSLARGVCVTLLPLSATVGAALWMTRANHAEAAETKATVTITGGHEIARGDFGRPVVLIAAALGVKPEVFREAFSGVTPSRNGPPSREEAQKNKAALMRVLAPHGITNDRLDEVSNYYRFRPQNDELWKHRPAAAHAIIENGQVKQVVLTDPGHGYSTPPQFSVAGHPDVQVDATLEFSQIFEKNGVIKAVRDRGRESRLISAPPPAKPDGRISRIRLSG